MASISAAAASARVRYGVIVIVRNSLHLHCLHRWVGCCGLRRRSTRAWADLPALDVATAKHAQRRHFAYRAPWVIKTADLTGFTGRKRSDLPLTPNPDQRVFDFQ